MARRKCGKKPAPKKRLPKLETSFACPFCSHSNSVLCTFDKKLTIGEASCCMCTESYCTKINYLTEAIDVYSEWLDACEAANSAPDMGKQEKTVSRTVRGWSIIDPDEDELFLGCKATGVMSTR